jgi:hypothetical protein
MARLKVTCLIIVNSLIVLLMFAVKFDRCDPKCPNTAASSG